jgi:hypothetical protein
MSQVSLQTGESKSLKEFIEKLKIKDEKMAQLQRANQDLQERVKKLKTRLKGKTLLQGDKHVILDSISAEAIKFRVYLNLINEKYIVATTTKSRCIFVNETLSKKHSEWAQNAIDLLNYVPTADLQTIQVKDKIVLIIWDMRIIAKNNLLKSVQNKDMKMEHILQEFRDTFEQLFIKGLPPFRDGKGNLYNHEDYNSFFI